MPYLIDSDWVIDHLAGAIEILELPALLKRHEIRPGHGRLLSKNASTRATSAGVTP